MSDGLNDSRSHGASRENGVTTPYHQNCAECDAWAASIFPLKKRPAPEPARTGHEAAAPEIASLEQSLEDRNTRIAGYHEWIRSALKLPDDAPMRFDYYAEKIGELMARIEKLVAALEEMQKGRVLCHDCGAATVFKRDGNDITVFHDCRFGHAASTDKEQSKVLAEQPSLAPQAERADPLVAVVANELAGTALKHTVSASYLLETAKAIVAAVRAELAGGAA